MRVDDRYIHHEQEEAVFHLLFLCELVINPNCRCWSRKKKGLPELFMIDVSIDFVCAYVLKIFFAVIS